MGALAQQPTLRPYVVFDRLPVGCFAHTVTTTDSEPVLRVGDTVVIDPSEHPFGSGELFLIEWKSGRQRRTIVEVFPMQGGVCRDDEGKDITHDCWRMGAIRREVMRTLNGEPVRDPRTNEPYPPMRWVDGPYRTEAVRDYVKGRVIGILEPGFNEPKRIGQQVQG